MRSKILALGLLLCVFGGMQLRPLEEKSGALPFAPSTELEFQGSSLPEAKLRLKESLKFPLLTGESPLTSGNNLTVSAAGEISPVAMNGLADLLFTPAAFFQLAGGARAGTGWNMALGSGIGINTPVGERTEQNSVRKQEYRGSAFGGCMWDLYGGAALQFDLAAVFPGDWNHILFRSYHEGRYRAYTGAAAGEPWVFENDDGENCNGWVYYGNIVLGYQMPRSPVLDTAAFMAEITKTFYGSPDGAAWGEDSPRWILSALFNFKITPKLSAALVLQGRTRRNYGDGDLNNEEKRYFRDKVLSGPSSTVLTFYRAALVVNYKLFTP